MLGRENVSAILGRELAALIEGQLQRGIVRLQQYIGYDGLVLQFGMLTLLPGILMSSDVPPRPAVKAAFLYMRDVVGHKIVAECIPFVH